MEANQVFKKRIQGMAVRILLRIEHILQADLEQVNDDEEFVLLGSDLKIIRSETLNAAGDTIRSLAALKEQPQKDRLSLPRAGIAGINRASVGFVKDKTGDEVPVFRIKIDGDFNLLCQIRSYIGAGVVYNNSYTCAGIDDIVNSLIPFLDFTALTGIKIADGDYREWRDSVCDMYLEGLGNE